MCIPFRDYLSELNHQHRSDTYSREFPLHLTISSINSRHHNKLTITYLTTTPLYLPIDSLSRFQPPTDLSCAGREKVSQTPFPYQSFSYTLVRFVPSLFRVSVSFVRTCLFRICQSLSYLSTYFLHVNLFRIFVYFSYVRPFRIYIFKAYDHSNGDR